MPLGVQLQRSLDGGSDDLLATIHLCTLQDRVDEGVVGIARPRPDLREKLVAQHIEALVDAPKPCERRIGRVARLDIEATAGDCKLTHEKT